MIKYGSNMAVSPLSLTSNVLFVRFQVVTHSSQKSPWSGPTDSFENLLPMKSLLTSCCMFATHRRSRSVLGEGERLKVLILLIRWDIVKKKMKDISV